MKKLDSSKAIVIFSGGQDSTTCLAWAIAEWGTENIIALTFNYNQRHEIELDCAERIAGIFGVKHDVISTDIFGMIPNLALLSKNKDLDISEIKDNLPASFVPGRNMFFLLIAGMYAYVKEISQIVIGVCQTDYSGYPDCRELSIQAVRNALCLCFEANIDIRTPLMFTSKASTFKMAETFNVLDVVLEYTNTCYEGSRKKNDWGYGCGECPACKLRAKGWAEYLEAKNG